MRLYLLMGVPAYSWMVNFSISYLDGNFNLSCDLWFIFIIWSLVNLPDIYTPIHTCTAGKQNEILIVCERERDREIER
jgi:hypothetical protein